MFVPAGEASKFGCYPDSSHPWVILGAGAPRKDDIMSTNYGIFPDARM